MITKVKIVVKIVLIFVGSVVGGFLISFILHC